jgi:TP901 family phage tail tape measure protein
MLQLQLAECYVDLVLNSSQFEAGVVIAITRLNALKGMGAIPLTMNISQAMAAITILHQQINALQQAANNLNFGGGGGGPGGGGGGGGSRAAAARSLAAQQSRAVLKDLMDQERAAKQLAAQQSRAVLAQMTADEKAAARAARGGGPLGRAATSFGMGALQGMGAAPFALNPSMMAGQMIGAGLKDAVSTAMDLETTFVGLQRVSGESAANIERFKGAIFDIGKSQAGVSIKDLTDIAGAGAKAGITDKEGLAGLERFTAGMAKVRNSIQGIGTEQLANDMTRLLNLFHKGTDYVESFGSVLARMDNVSTSSAADIMDISKSLAGTFASLGMTIPQVMAFSSVLSDVGLTNQQGAGSFSQILRMMASQSEEMAGLIGVPVEKFQNAIRTNAMDALGMLIGKFRELNEVDPVKAQEFLVSLGFRGVKTAGALQQLSSMFEQVQERTQMAIEEESNLGSLLSANALNSTTATGNIQKLKNAFEELADAIGSRVVPHMTDLSKLALNLFNQMAGGKEGGPKRLGFMEEMELKFMNMVGGELSPEFEARRNDLNQRAEAFAASANNLALEAGPVKAEDLKKGPGGQPTEAQAFNLAMAEAAIPRDLVARPLAGIGEEMARANDRMAATIFPAGLEGPRQGGGRGGTAFAIADTERELKAQREIERSARAAANARGQDEAGTKATRATLAAAVADRVTLERSLAEMRGTGATPLHPGEVERLPAGMRGAMLARPKEAEDRSFRSQAFSDPADFARSFVQDMLSKDDVPAKQLTVAEDTLTVMEDIAAKLTPTFGQQTNNGPMIMRGASSPP